MTDYGHWDIADVGEFDPAEWFGFIYEIEQVSSGKAYIGKKFFKFKRKKTKTNKSRTKDSDWRDYTSSSDVLNDLIEEHGKDDFRFRILLLCSGRCMLSYEEESIQRARDVLRAKLPNGERKYFNRTIGYKNFAGLEAQTEESNRRRAEALKGRLGQPHTAEERKVISDQTAKAMASEAVRQHISDTLMQQDPVVRSDRARKAQACRSRESLAHAGRVSGAQNALLGRGVCGRSAEQMHADGISGGKVTGTKPWWTNGVIQTRSIDMPEGENWRRGRLPRTPEERQKISAGMKRYAYEHLTPAK